MFRKKEASVKLIETRKMMLQFPGNDCWILHQKPMRLDLSVCISIIQMDMILEALGMHALCLQSVTVANKWNFKKLKLCCVLN